MPADIYHPPEGTINTSTQYEPVPALDVEQYTQAWSVPRPRIRPTYRPSREEVDSIVTLRAAIAREREVLYGREVHATPVPVDDPWEIIGEPISGRATRPLSLTRLQDSVKSKGISGLSILFHKEKEICQK